MPKAIALAIEENPFSLALASLKNFSRLALDFMYGTEERTRVTYAFAVALALLGAGINIADTHAAMMSCSHDTLAAL